ncbi:hypothetical protein LCGC14_2574190, partial [marine sediment metagenome]
YKFEMTDDDHRRLLAALKAIPAVIMLSGYRNPVYKECIADWHTIDYQAMTRGGPRTETLWMNFEPGGEIHWHGYAGSNYTDRQRIKRKGERWAAMYKKLPPVERQAVLSAMLSSDIPAGVDDPDYDPGAPSQLPLL